MVEDIDDIFNDNKDVKQQLGIPDDANVSINKWEIEDVSIYDANFKFESNIMNDSFLLGVPTHAILGTSKLGDRSDGYVIEEEQTNNQKITDDGVNQIIAFLREETSENPTHTAIGTGTSTYFSTQTELVTEVDTRRVPLANITSTKQINYTVIYRGETITDVTEFGLFNASSTGKMFNRRVFSATSFNNTTQYRFTSILLLGDL